VFRYVAPAISLLLLLITGDGLMPRIAQVLMAAMMWMVATTARCENWVYLSDTSEAFLLFDFDSIKSDKTRSGSNMKIWMQTITRNPKKTPNTVLTAKTLFRVHCENETIALVTTAGYAAGGKVIRSNNNEQSDQAVVPGSVGDTLMKNACNESVRLETLRVWMDSQDKNKATTNEVTTTINIDGVDHAIDKEWKPAQVDAYAYEVIANNRAKTAAAKAQPTVQNREAKQKKFAENK
jgi:hypothetical protein